MTVRVNKSPVNIREKLNELERPIGLKGSELARAETLQEARDLVSAGRKNYIINGDFKIWQRGTSGSVGTGNRNYKSADRWFNFNAGDTTSQIDLSSVSIGGVTGRFRYGMRVSGSQSSRILGQCIEGPLPAGDYIFSAWVRFSEIPVNFYMTHNSSALIGENNFAGWYGGSGVSISYTKPDNISEVSQTGVWYYVYKKFTAVSPHLGLGIAFQPIFAGSTSATVDITGVQVEAGKNATDFEHRSYGEELLLCQRYFQKIGKAGHGGAGKNDYIASGFVDSNGSEFYGGANLKVTMRASPTISLNGTASHLGYTHPSAVFVATGLTSYWSNPQSYAIRISGTGSGTTGYGAYARITNDATQLEFNAEL